ncbi:hypothetical protein KSP40_PGU017808 [Platanthera guangdongensis]|uniref:Uncharacterized protein n=1 Tax=Platanthera guangdongensis TaxID=2320717 RepID=A0ABR2M5Q5_9ASPA
MSIRSFAKQSRLAEEMIRSRRQPDKFAGSSREVDDNLAERSSTGSCQGRWIGVTAVIAEGMWQEESVGGSERSSGSQERLETMAPVYEIEDRQQIQGWRGSVPARQRNRGVLKTRGGASNGEKETRGIEDRDEEKMRRGFWNAWNRAPSRGRNLHYSPSVRFYLPRHVLVLQLQVFNEAGYIHMVEVEFEVSMTYWSLIVALTFPKSPTEKSIPVSTPNTARQECKQPVLALLRYCHTLHDPQ